jgi:hypothetical protein
MNREFKLVWLTPVTTMAEEVPYQVEYVSLYGNSLGDGTAAQFCSQATADGIPHMLRVERAFQQSQTMCEARSKKQWSGRASEQGKKR